MAPGVRAKKKTMADEPTKDTAAKDTETDVINKRNQTRRGVKGEEKTSEQEGFGSKPSKRMKQTKKSKSHGGSDDDDDDKIKDVTASTKRTRVASKTKTKAAPKEDNEKSTSSAEASPAKRARKAPAHQVLTERDVLPKLWDETKAQANGSYTFKIASWNVAGLRALMKNAPTALSELVEKRDLDVLCLQETKLQEQHLDDPKLAIRGHLLEGEGYDAYYSCSAARKGYSGTAVFVKRRSGASRTKASKQSTKQTSLGSFLTTEKNDTTKKEAGSKKDKKSLTLPIDASELVPLEVTYEMGQEKHDAEGRLIVVDFPLFTMINVYVPNSGQKLERLDYRTEEWDKDLLNFVQKKQSDRGLPIMWVGDLNVAHTNLEVWNDGAKHLSKQAGVTPQERASFQGQLDSGFIDAFRRLHGDARGHYSYWSQRAGNREPNKGLRLDYFVCDPALFEEDSRVVVRDSYMDFEQLGSDHAPVILELEIKPRIQEKKAQKA